MLRERRCRRWVAEDPAQRRLHVARREEAEVVVRYERAGKEDLRIHAPPCVERRLLVGLDNALLGAVERTEDGAVDILRLDLDDAPRKRPLRGELREELRVVRQALRERGDLRHGRG